MNIPEDPLAVYLRPRSIAVVRSGCIPVCLTLGLAGLIGFVLQFAVHPGFPLPNGGSPPAPNWTSWLSAASLTAFYGALAMSATISLYRFRHTARKTDLLGLALCVGCFILIIWGKFARVILFVQDPFVDWPIRSAMFITAALLFMHGKSRDR